MQVLPASSTMEAAPLLIKPPRRTWRARLARWSVMLVIFLAGGVAGYSVGTVRSIDFGSPETTVMKQPSEFTSMLLAKLKVDLSLTDAQYPEVEKIIVRHHQAFSDLRQKTQPLFEKLMAQLERDMESVLDPTQYQRYKERMKNRFRRGPSSSGGPGRGPRHEGHRDYGPGGRDHRPPHDKRSADGASPGSSKDGSQVKPVEAPKAEPAAEKAPDSK